MSRPTTTSAATRTPGSAAVPAGENVDVRVNVVFGVLMLGMLMSALGQMIFATALPTIVGDLGGVEHMSWVITAFLLAQTIAMPVAGKAGDMVGRKILFTVGITVFTVGSALGGAAQGMTMLIVARTLQGIAAGTLMVTSQAITAEIIPARVRGKYMGYIGAVFGFCSVAGPVLGGVFTAGPGWRWALWMNIPLGILVLLGTWRFLHLRKRETVHDFDYLGTVALAAAASSLILAVTWGGRMHPWGSPEILGLFGVTFIAVGAFILLEQRAANPILPLALFANRNFLCTTGGGLLLGVGMFGLMAYVPTYLQMSHAMTPMSAGLMMTPMMAGMLLTSITVGWIIARTGHYKWYPVTGMAIAALMMLPLSRLSHDDPLWLVGLCLFGLGFGMGLAMQVLVLIVQNSFPLRVVGTATAGNNFFRQIGGATGAAVVGSVFLGALMARLSEAIGPSFNPAMARSLTPDMLSTMEPALRDIVMISYNDAFTPVFLLMAPLFAVAAIILSFVREDVLSETVE
ncbi:MDR family MFS transporter [Corynebacterium sp. 335C]